MNPEQQENFDKMKKMFPGMKDEVYELMAKAGYTCGTYKRDANCTKDDEVEG